jgi:ribosome biogenesis protein UTP30
MASNLEAPSSTTISKSKVKLETIDKAVNALIKWKLSESKSEKAQLMPQDDLIYLVVSLAKIPANGGRTKPYKFPLPHPLHLDDPLSSEICLIIDDRAKSNLTSAEAKKKIKSEDIPVSKVLKFSKLKTDYKPFQKKRQLCDSYDLFLADRRVIPLLPKLLGKQFFKKKKLPLTVDLGHKNWKMQVKSACSSGLLFMGTGTCSVVKVGKSSMEVAEIIENVAAAIAGIIELIPKKWSSLRSLHLKFSDSVPLPIFQTVPDVKLRIDGIQSNVEKVEEEESEAKEIEVKKDEKSGKRKGRIQEVRYMDASVDEAAEKIVDDAVEKIADESHDDDGDMETDRAKSDGKKRKQSDASSAKKKKKSEVVSSNEKNASGDEANGKLVENNNNDDVEIGSLGNKRKQSDSSNAKKKTKSKDETPKPKAKLSKREALEKAKVENEVEKSESKSSKALKNATVTRSAGNPKEKSRKNDALKKAKVETDDMKSKKSKKSKKNMSAE